MKKSLGRCTYDLKSCFVSGGTVKTFRFDKLPNLDTTRMQCRLCHYIYHVDKYFVMPTLNTA